MSGLSLIALSRHHHIILLFFYKIVPSIFWWKNRKERRKSLSRLIFGGIINNVYLGGGLHMGKRLFQEVYASQDRTDALALPELIVVSEEDDRDTVDFTYHTVHKSYFS